MEVLETLLRNEKVGGEEHDDFGLRILDCGFLRVI